jgi:predicted RNA-binding protein with RPS1 domain
VGKFNVNDIITARVMNINSDERRIGLSIKRLEIEDEQSLLSEYVNNVRPATSTFGEILRENLQERESLPEGEDVQEGENLLESDSLQEGEDLKDKSKEE